MQKSDLVLDKMRTAAHDNSVYIKLLDKATHGFLANHEELDPDLLPCWKERDSLNHDEEFILVGPLSYFLLPFAKKFRPAKQPSWRGGHKTRQTVWWPCINSDITNARFRPWIGTVLHHDKMAVPLHRFCLDTLYVLVFQPTGRFLLQKIEGVIAAQPDLDSHCRLAHTSGYKAAVAMGLGRSRDYLLRAPSGQVLWRIRRFLRVVPTLPLAPVEDKRSSDDVPSHPARGSPCPRRRHHPRSYGSRRRSHGIAARLKAYEREEGDTLRML